MYTTIILSLLSLAAAQNSTTSEIIPLLRNGSLVPSIVPTFNATIGPLVITYPQGIVNYGNSIANAATLYAPNITFPAEANYPDAEYTLAMVDPDAPTPQNPTSAQIRHWLVSNVSPSTSPQNLSLVGTVLSAYRSPMPPAGSDPHRYSFFLLRQPSGANVTIGNQTAVSNFNVATFIRQNQLVPVSGNYFNQSRTSNTTSTSSGGGGSTNTSGTSTATTPASGAAVLQASQLFVILLTIAAAII